MECYSSKKKRLGLLLMTIIIAGSAIFAATRDDPIDRIVGWIGIALIGLGLILIPTRLVRHGPTLIIDHRGIEDCRLGIGILLWEDIASLKVDAIGSVQFVSVELMDPKKYVPWMPWWTRPRANANKRFGHATLDIGFVELEPGLEDAWEYIQHRWQMELRERTKRYADILED